MQKITCKDIDKFYDNYINNLNKSYSIENELLKKNPNSSKWITMLYDKSNELRELFSVNENDLNTYIRPFMTGKEPLTLDICKCFLTNANKFLKLRYVDSAITLDICHEIYNYLFENYSTDYDLLCFCASLIGYFESILIRLKHPNRAVEFFDIAISYTDKFDLLSDETKLRLVACYFNRLVASSRKDELFASDFIKYYNEACDFFDNEKYTNYDFSLFSTSQLKEWSASITCSVLLKVSPNYSSIELTEDTINFAFEIASTYYNSYLEKYNNIYQIVPSIYASYHKGLLLKGIIDKATYFEKLLDYYNNIDTTVDFTKPDYSDSIYFESLHRVVPALIIYADYGFKNEDDVKNFRYKLSLEVITFLENIPHLSKTTQVNYLIFELFKLCIPHLRNEEEMIFSITNLYISKQISTAIHVSMVSRISQLILRSIITHKPYLLTCLDCINDVNDVKKYEKELYYHINHAALCHDIGKIAIGSVINLQTRKLCDKEFELIKIHPKLGADVLRNIPALKKYADVANGHHKFYDGTFGYPNDFDNTASPCRIFIDIITVSDCIDAATDTLGRNYTKAKNFYDILEELNAEKGTRYSPDIIDLLNEDSSLSECLYDLTIKGRLSIYNKIYSLINEK